MQDRIGTPVNWMLSAVGRAYLAYCPESERQKIVTLLRKLDKPENRIARDGRRVDRILAETRANGYGTRDPSFIGGAYGRQAPDGLAGIAVPLADRTRVHGVINIVWAKSAGKSMTWFGTIWPICRRRHLTLSNHFAIKCGECTARRKYVSYSHRPAGRERQTSTRRLLRGHSRLRRPAGWPAMSGVP
jgi:hypothetical protein